MSGKNFLLLFDTFFLREKVISGPVLGWVSLRDCHLGGLGCNSWVLYNLKLMFTSLATELKMHSTVEHKSLCVV